MSYVSALTINEIEDLTRHMKFMKRAFDEFHKFHMK